MLGDAGTRHLQPGQPRGRPDGDDRDYRAGNDGRAAREHGHGRRRRRSRTNPADNTDDAETVVPAPLVPPKAKPKPAPDLCRTLAVGPKLLKANGKVQTVTIKVVEGKKPAKGVKIKITGPGINRTVTTNAKGIVRVTLKLSKAGILKFTIANAKACNAQRVGVVGVFEPPVTG